MHIVGHIEELHQFSYVHAGCVLADLAHMYHVPLYFARMSLFETHVDSPRVE